MDSPSAVYFGNIEKPKNHDHGAFFRLILTCFEKGIM